MWKFVTRGIRETFERRACRTNVYSQTSSDGNTKSEVKTSLTCNHKFLAPSISAYNNGFCGSTKANGAKDKDYESKWNTKYTWSEAVGWSSILAIGWVVCQTLCLRRRFFEKEKPDALKSKIPQLPEARVSCLFGQVLNLRPKHVLPITNCVGNSNINYIQEDNEAEWKSNKPFGPITVEEALKEATDEFANTHKLVMGEFELRYGLKALEEKRYKEAIKHFAAGANLSSSASMFNLGLCHELGLGTLVDQVKAAQCYRDAAKKGHADAIYNLGVFHAQGRGGFSVNANRARDCFIKAAELGQIHAQRALDLDKQYYEPEENSDSFSFSESLKNTIHNNRNMNHIFQKLVHYKNTLQSNSHMESALNSPDSDRNIDNAKNPTEIFLDFLGLNEPKLVPRGPMLSNKCSVPC